jgi:hypothetical protein
VDITLNGAPPDIQLLGSASLDAERASLAERFVRSVVVVLIREWSTRGRTHRRPTGKI